MHLQKVNIGVRNKVPLPFKSVYLQKFRNNYYRKTVRELMQYLPDICKRVSPNNKYYKKFDFSPFSCSTVFNERKVNFHYSVTVK